MSESDQQPSRRHDRVLDELQRQTDRGAAIVGAAYVEESLNRGLDAQFKRLASIEPDLEARVARRLFGASGPLGTFNSKIDLALKLGLIGPMTHRDLHLIRRIRNEFAHFAEPIGFDTSSVASRCRELWLPDNFPEPLYAPPATAARERYLTAVHATIAYLEYERDQRLASPLDPRPPILP